MRVGIDAGNGTAVLTAVPVIANLGCEVHELFTEMDGTFPNHEADPTVAANMADLVALVQAKQLDVGLGFDGDGDRLGVVDADGRLDLFIVQNFFIKFIVIILFSQLWGRRPLSSLSMISCLILTPPLPLIS